MQVFKTFMKVMLKRLHTAMIYIGIFIGISIAITLTSTNSETGFATSRLKVCVIDNDNTPSSHALVDYIGKNHTLVEVENNKDAMLDALYYLDASEILTINEGYEENLSVGNTNNLFCDIRVPGTISSEFFDNQINQYIGNVNAYIAGGMDISEAVEKTAELSEDGVEVKIIGKDKDNTSFSTGVSTYYQYFAYIIIAVLISALCPTIITMTSDEISKRTNCSCVSSTKQMVQIVAGTTIFSIGIFIILIIASLVLYGSELFTTKGLLTLLKAYVYLIFAEMLTMFYAISVKSQVAVNIISNVFCLGMSFLCGVFVPQMLLSDTVLSIGKFMPAYWYIKANNMLAGSNNEVYSTSEFITCISVELAFSVAMFCVILLVAKAKRKSKSL